MAVRIDKLPFVPQEGMYGDVYGYSVTKKNAKLSDKYCFEGIGDPLSEGETKESAQCFAKIRHLGKSITLADNHCVYLDKAHKRRLGKKTIQEWLDFLNVAYGKDIYSLIWDTKSPENTRVTVNLKEVLKYIKLGKDKRSTQYRYYFPALLALSLPRFLYEESKPSLVKLSLIIHKEHPKADFMHCIRAADLLFYLKYSRDSYKCSNHTFLNSSLVSLMTFSDYVRMSRKGLPQSDCAGANIKRISKYSANKTEINKADIKSTWWDNPVTILKEFGELAENAGRKEVVYDFDKLPF